LKDRTYKSKPIFLVAVSPADLEQIGALCAYNLLFYRKLHPCRGADGANSQYPLADGLWNPWKVKGEK